MSIDQDQEAPERMVKLAAAALQFARRRDADRATRAMTLLGQEFGWAGITVAMQGWIDTMLAQRGAVQGEQDRILRLGYISADGTEVEGIGGLPRARQWAARLCAARMAMDKANFVALVHSVPAEQMGEHINALLATVATNMNEYDKQAPLLNLLRAGLHWLYRTEQPAGVVMTHHGVTAPALGDRQFSFTPDGTEHLPVLAVKVVNQNWVEKGMDRILTNGMHAGELAQIAQLVRVLGYPIRDTWNGREGSDTGSIGLARPAHPTLLATVNKYRAGCPEHRSVLCGWQGCTWYGDNSKALIKPRWPQPAAAPAGTDGGTADA